MKENKSETLYDYADPRALHMISKGFVGSKHGNYGYNSDTLVSFDTSHEDATPTQTVQVGNYHYCNYCSRVALPIQAGLNQKIKYSNKLLDYGVTGYTCVCEGAMDEVQLKKDIQIINNRLEKFKQKCQKSINNLQKQHEVKNPNTAAGLVERIIQNKISKMTTIQELKEFFSTLDK